MAYAVGKKVATVMIDNEMAKRAFEAMYGVWSLLLEKEARSRRRANSMKKISVDRRGRSC